MDDTVKITVVDCYAIAKILRRDIEVLMTW